MLVAIKDDIAIWLSILAFVLSLYATLAGELRARDERRRTIRAQLSDVLDRLASLQLENAKLLHEAGGDAAYLQAVGAALSQQNGFLVDQAVFLADQIPPLVTTYEYNTVATASFGSGNVFDANRFHRAAIKSAKLPLYRAQATRAYAVFLFAQHDFPAARRQFQAALASFSGAGNLARQTNGITWQTWAWNERHLAHDAARAAELFAKARAEYAAIDLEFLRAAMLQSLALAELGQAPGVMGAASPAPAGAPPPAR